jgi:hypothetical protein
MFRIFLLKKMHRNFGEETDRCMKVAYIRATKNTGLMH